MISANGEREIGELIAKAMEKVGKEGVITISVSFYLIILLISVVCLFYLWKVFCFLPFFCLSLWRKVWGLFNSIILIMKCFWKLPMKCSYFFLSDSIFGHPG